jgi:4-amino-4-deoxy-L-arabinose transferase-like glycosyltransferase
MKILKDPILILLLVAASFLIFANLDNIYLWQDEAETAIIARGILDHGYPRGIEGENILRVICGFGDNYLWVGHTWLQFYLVALSYLIFGITTFASRFPFAVLGILCVYLTYLLGLRLFNNKTISRISCLLLVFSVPFLLHTRQCRYYSLTAFMVLLMILAYLTFVERKKFSTIKFMLSAILLFHSNHGAFIPVAGALFLHFMIFYFRKKDVKKLLGVCCGVALFTLPWFVFLKSWRHGRDGLTFTYLRHQFEFYFRVINKYIFPIGFFAAIFMLRGIIARGRKKFFPSLNIDMAGGWLIPLIIIVNVVFFLFVEQRYFRYLFHLIPLFFIVEAAILAKWFKINKYLTALVLIILVFTSFFHRFKMSSPLLNYLYEITHDYDGPNEGVVKFLSQNAKPQDTVKVPYGDRPVIFYNKLRVDSRPFFENETYPEWIVFRKDWLGDSPLEHEYFKTIESRYEKIVLDYPDIRWGNRPDLGYHKFRTVKGQPPVIIYKKVN